MTLTNPIALWLLAAIPLLCLLAWRSRRLHAGSRLSVATLVRSIIVLFLAVALAQPVSFERSQEQSVVYAIDVSRSVSSSFLNQALDWADTANERYQPSSAKFLLFGDRAQSFDSADQALSAEVNEGASARSFSSDSIGHGPSAIGPGAIGQGATDIEAALHTAIFNFSPHHAKRLVLITDGNATRGDAWRALPRLQKEGVRVFAMPAQVSASNDAWVESIVFPSGVRRQEPVSVRILVRSLTKVGAEVELSAGKRRLGKR